MHIYLFQPLTMTSRSSNCGANTVTNTLQIGMLFCVSDKWRIYTLRNTLKYVWQKHDIFNVGTKMKVKRDNDSPLGPTMWDMQWVQDVEIADGHPGDPKHTFFFWTLQSDFFSFFKPRSWPEIQVWNTRRWRLDGEEDEDIVSQLMRIRVLPGLHGKSFSLWTL